MCYRTTVKQLRKHPRLRRMPRKGGKKKAEEGKPDSSTSSSPQEVNHAKKNTDVREEHQEELGYVPSEQTQWLMGIIRNTASSVMDEKLTDDTVENTINRLM